MSVPINGRVNSGAYDRPFSGVGIEFDPLGIKPGRSGVSLHETGFLAANSQWNFPAVFSPFWRFYQNASRGHCVLFGERMVELLPGAIMLIPPHCLFHCLGGNPVPSFWMAFSFSRRLHGSIAPPVLLKARDTEMCLIRDLKNVILPNSSLRPDEAVNRLFNLQLGTSPARYVSEMRVREAARLLLQTGDTVDGIPQPRVFHPRVQAGCRGSPRRIPPHPPPTRKPHPLRIASASTCP